MCVLFVSISFILFFICILCCCCLYDEIKIYIDWLVAGVRGPVAVGWCWSVRGQLSKLRWTRLLGRSVYA